MELNARIVKQEFNLNMFIARLFYFIFNNLF